MRHRLRPLLAVIALSGALAGGGAAIASAATSSTSTTASSTKTMPAPVSPGHAGTSSAHKGGSKNCPNM